MPDDLIERRSAHTPDSRGSKPQPALQQELQHRPGELSREQLRHSIRQRRAAIDIADLQRAGDALCIQLQHHLHYLSEYASVSLPEIDSNKKPVVAGYLAVSGEISLHQSLSWLRSLGCITCVPIINQQTLQFAAFDEHTTWVSGQYGIRIPQYNSDELFEAAQLDIAFVPLVGFDTDGNRLGMGGGYYDRTFAYRLPAQTARSTTASKPNHADFDTDFDTSLDRDLNKVAQQRFIGVAHDFQRLPTVPVESWDVPLDSIVTDQKIYLTDAQA